MDTDVLVMLCLLGLAAGAFAWAEWVEPWTKRVDLRRRSHGFPVIREDRP